MRREFKAITKCSDVIGFVTEWKTVWEPKVLSFGEREAATSKSLSKKLLGECDMIMLMHAPQLLS